MNLWNKILAKSGLDECKSIAEHLCTSLNNSTVSEYINNDTFVGINKLKPILASLNPIDGIFVTVNNIKNVSVDVGDYEEVKVSLDSKKLITVTIQCPC